MQSPIKLTYSTAYQLSRPTDLLQINYPVGQSYNVTFDQKNPAHGNFQLSPSSCPTIKYNGDDFRLALVHIHLGSEHIVDSLTPHCFEVHFVHVPVGGTTNDRKVVIGILYEETTSYSLGGLEKFGKQTPSREKMQQVRSSGESLTLSLTPTAFFPALSKDTPDLVNWYHYEGSLTSFPYTENVSWFVMQNPASVNPNNTAELKRHAEQDARILQPLDRRIVVRSFPDPKPATAPKVEEPARRSRKRKS